jgi:hypothetical protein
MLPKTAPPQRNSLTKEKSIRIPKLLFGFENNQTDRDRRARKRKERTEKLNNIIDPAKK